MSKLARAGLVSAILVIPVLAACQATASTATEAATVPTAAPTAPPTSTKAPDAPTPTAVPTPTPILLPSGGPVAGLAADTAVGAGTYEIGAPFAVPFAVQIPEDSTFRGIEAGNVSFATPNGTLEAFVPQAVFPDPCHITGDPVAVDTADALVDALTSMKGFSATKPVTTTVSGHPTRSFVLTNTVDTATAKCSQNLMLPMFTFPGHPEGIGTNGGQRQVVWVVDADGRPMLVLGDGWQDIERGTLEALVRTIELR